MPALTRRLALSTFAACFALVLGASPAAATTHHKHHAKTRHHVSHASHTSGSSITRIAQRHLYNLGYYAGKCDGIMGPQTRAAIKKFQREQGLKADGVLGSKTNRALDRADAHGVSGSGGGFGTHEEANPPDLSVPGTFNPDYNPGLHGGTSTIPSRYAQIVASESGEGAAKRYDVTINGDPLLIADGQPAIITISPTYDLGDEDAVIFTTYSPHGGNCIYRNHILALNGNGNGKLLDIDNCTRDYQAVAKNGSLFITFSERDSGSVTGSTWRLEGTALNKL